MNALARFAYRLASRALDWWARLTHPTVSGASVLVWRGEELLLIQTSYRAWRGTPGGRIERGEDPRSAAARELQEETGLRVAAAALTNLGTWIVGHSHLEEHAHFYSCRASDASGEIRIDDREIVWAGYVAREELERLALWPPLRAVLDGGLGPGP